MWIVSLLLLLVFLIVPFSMTAAAGWLGGSLSDRRDNLKAMFGAGCLLYAIVVSGMGFWGFCHQPPLGLGFLFGSMILWALPLASSAVAVGLFWGTDPTPPANLGLTQSSEGP